MEVVEDWREESGSRLFFGTRDGYDIHKFGATCFRIAAFELYARFISRFIDHQGDLYSLIWPSHSPIRFTKTTSNTAVPKCSFSSLAMCWRNYTLDYVYIRKLIHHGWHNSIALRKSPSMSYRPFPRNISKRIPVQISSATIVLHSEETSVLAGSCRRDSFSSTSGIRSLASIGSFLIRMLSRTLRLFYFPAWVKPHHSWKCVLSLGFGA
jgi:hypothetical protein